MSYFYKPSVVFVHPQTRAKLFIGGQEPASNKAMLEEMKIFHVVNCQGSSGENYHERDPRFTYLRYGISEDLRMAHMSSAEGVFRFLEPLHSFIDKALHNGNNVMVHCLAGAHRAGTAGVSYMMRRGNMTYREAVKLAKKQRPCVDPMGHLE